MLNKNNNEIVKIGILEISSQNKAVLEFFFSGTGQTLFEEVDLDNASAFITDYDFPGAKESWEQSHKATNKPGIIISIHEVDLPSTVWIPKPLTAQALTEAGQKIKKIIIESKQTNDVTTNVKKAAPMIQEVTAKEPAMTEVELVDYVTPEENILSKQEPPKSDIDSTSFDEASIGISSPEPKEVEAVKAESLGDTNVADIIEIDTLLETLISGKGGGSTEPDTLETTPQNIISNDSSILEETIEQSIKNETQDLVPNDAVLGELVDEDTYSNDTLAPSPMVEETTPDIQNTTEEIILEDDIATNEVVNSDTAPPQKNDLDIADKTDNTNSDSESDIESLNKINIDQDSKETPEISLTTQVKDNNSAEEELQRLLEEIRQEAEGNSLFTETDNDSTESDFENKQFNTTAEKRWALTCGDNEKITNDVELKTISYDPDEHLLSLFKEVLTKASSAKEVMRIKLGNTIITVNAETDTVYCNNPIMETHFANFCYRPIDKKQVKIHPLDASEIRMFLKKQKTEPETSHSIDAFIWTTSLLISRGRLPIKTDLNKTIGLTHWPNLTRLESFPHAMQIAAVFKKETGSLLEITQWLDHVPQCSIIAFYNGALALGLIEEDFEKLESRKKITKSTNKNKDKGFFSRLLKRITK